MITRWRIYRYLHKNMRQSRRTAWYIAGMKARERRINR